MPSSGRSEPVTALREIRCKGKFRGGTCNRVLFMANMTKPLKPGSKLEIKCGKCEEVSYLDGGPSD